MLGATAFLNGLLGGRERRDVKESVVRTCMADKGYRRVEAPGDIRAELKQLKDEERVDRLVELASASEPQGKVLPL